MNVKDLPLSVVNTELFHTKEMSAKIHIEIHSLLNWCFDVLECRNFSLWCNIFAVYRL